MIQSIGAVQVFAAVGFLSPVALAAAVGAFAWGLFGILVVRKYATRLPMRSAPVVLAPHITPVRDLSHAA